MQKTYPFVSRHDALTSLLCYACTGDKAGGCVRALYDPTLSERGVLLCAARKPRVKDPLDFEVSSKLLRC